MPFEITEATSAPVEITSGTTAQTPLTSSEAPMIETSPFMNTAPLRIIMFDPSTEMPPSAFPATSPQSLKLLSPTQEIPIEVSSEIPVQVSSEIPLPASSQALQEPIKPEEAESPSSDSDETRRVPAEEDIDTRFNQDSSNFEQFRSNDVTSSFFGRQAMQPNFGLFPQYFMPPRPFSYPQQEQQIDPNNFSSSSASMNLNGQFFNYLTYHR